MAIRSTARYIGKNEEIESQFCFYWSDLFFSLDLIDAARCCRYYGGGQGNQAQIATS
jgi:hypothetical protein